MHRLIIDTDPGVDDAQAIAYALAHPDISVEGLTTVFGNASVDITTRNALQLLDVFDASEIPVAQGADQPLQIPRFASPDFVHGEDAMGDIGLPPPTNSVDPRSAAQFIVDSANELQGELTLVAIGPLTNIAAALQLDAGLPAKVNQLVIMGGTVVEPGNVTPVAEANFIGDPHAAEMVLAQDWPATVIGLDVTHQTLLYDQDLEKISTHCGEAGDLLRRSSRFYFDFYRGDQELEKHEQSRAPMHDASALVYLTNPEAFSCTAGAACVIKDGPAMGQLALDRKGSPYVLPHWEERPKISVAMQVHAAKVHDNFVETLLRGFAA